MDEEPKLLETTIFFSLRSATNGPARSCGLGWLLLFLHGSAMNKSPKTGIR